jgi:transcriptional regulator of aroF, aroG, tyrA and aromatic amino acid transport
MRIHVTFIDRVGITQEVLALLGSCSLNLDAVEMAPPNVYIDAPSLSAEVLDELQVALHNVAGVQAVTVVDILPGQRRNLQLEALLAAMDDPVLTVDRDGVLLSANPAFSALCGQHPLGQTLAALFGNAALAQTLIDQGFRLPLCEITLSGQTLLVDSVPITEGSHLAGALLSLYPPNRIGGRLAALHHNHAEGFDALLGESPSIHELKARAQRLAVSMHRC